MKTNQLMTVAFSEGGLRIWHKTGMGNLTDLFTIGNKIRRNENRKEKSLTIFMKTKMVQDFIKIIMKNENKKYDEVVKVVGKGNKRHTEVCPHLLVFSAQHLSMEFHYEVIDRFIAGKILEWRDDSGDEFKAVNICIDKYLPGREGKENNKGIFIQIARLIKQKVQPYGDNWNTATADELRLRTKLEIDIVRFLELGFIQDWDHLKELIQKM